MADLSFGFNADHASYDVFIEGIEDPIFENVGVATTGDQMASTSELNLIIAVI